MTLTFYHTYNHQHCQKHSNNWVTCQKKRKLSSNFLGLATYFKLNSKEATLNFGIITSHVISPLKHNLN